MGAWLVDWWVPGYQGSSLLAFVWLPESGAAREVRGHLQGLEEWLFSNCSGNRSVF